MTTDPPNLATPTAIPPAEPVPTPAEAPAIQVQRLTHSFRAHRALDCVSFSVQRRSIHGFVGPNGAGKTTTLKIAATLLTPQAGTVQIFGLDIVREQRQIRRRIGFMPDHFSMYRQMTVYEYLDFFGAAYGLTAAQRDRTITDVLALTDMEGRRNDAIRKLSRGMQQRVSLARVLVNDPDLLLLDEPASGLDPRARIELMEILQELRRLGKTVFISSHILTELAQLCDSVTIIDRGQVKYSGSMRRLLHQEDQPEVTYVLRVSQAVEALAARLGALAGVLEVTPPDGEAEPRYLVRMQRGTVEPSAVLRAALEGGANIVAFQPEQRHLNEAFMDLTEPGVRA